MKTCASGRVAKFQAAEKAMSFRKFSARNGAAGSRRMSPIRTDRASPSVGGSFTRASNSTPARPRTTPAVKMIE